jgi:hypothetical protein
MKMRAERRRFTASKPKDDEDRVFNRAERRKMAQSFARRTPGQQKPNAAQMREARKNIAEALKPTKKD